MAKIYCKSSYLLRKDTAENWQNKNPILRKGEQGLETDTGIMKIGDGATEYNRLSDDNIYLPKSYNKNIDQTYNPTSENAQSGIAVAEAISPMRQTITVDTPVWEVQPIIEGTLNENFKTWESQAYYMTLKNTDGTALESGQFKLCTRINGYASAIDQIFTLSSGVTLSENKAVDFKTISLDRTTFEMRDAGVSSIYINTKNPKSQRYIFSVFQYAVAGGSSSLYYIYQKDNIGRNLGDNAAYLTNVGSYSGYTGFLFGGISYSYNVPIYKIGYTIEINRTKIGLNASMCGLTSTEKTFNFSGYSDYTKGVNDVTKENIYWFSFGGGSAPSTLSFGNGTIITLEEFA